MDTKKLKSYFSDMRKIPVPRDFLQHREFFMSEQMNKLLGDTPARTIVKLVVVSLIVGFIMAVFGLRPMDIFSNIRFFLLDLWYTGFDALGRVGDYLLLGGAIVVPVFIILRLFSYRR